MSQQFFAQLDENNIVTKIKVVTAEFMAENPERYPGVWVETFYNTNGKTYAGLGYVYDYDTENFTAPVVEPDNEQ